MTGRQTPEARVKVKILQSRRLSLEGVLRKVGDVVKVSESQAHAWVANGWVELVKPGTKKKQVVKPGRGERLRSEAD